MSDIRSTTTSPATSPMLKPSNIQQPNGDPQAIPQRSSKGHEETAIRLLTFGQESVDMLQSVSNVFSDTVDRAEVWLDRLRSMRGGNSNTTASNDPQSDKEERIQLPPIRSLDLPPTEKHQRQQYPGDNDAMETDQ